MSYENEKLNAKLGMNSKSCIEKGYPEEEKAALDVVERVCKDFPVQGQQTFFNVFRNAMIAKRKERLAELSKEHIDLRDKIETEEKLLSELVGQ